MALEPRQRTASLGNRVDSSAGVDEGLRSYMLRVYNYMTLGLALTGVIAFGVSSSPVIVEMIYSNVVTAWAVMLAPLAFVLVFTFGINKLSTPMAQALFWAFAAVMGLSMTSIFIVYTDASIARVFFISASVFAAMSLYGYTTKRDLTGMGSFLMMGLFGLVLASIVNVFLESVMMDFVVSIIGVLIFVGFTAYDTQKIKSEYDVNDSAAIREKNAVYGALHLYLDFINLFMFMLHLFGSRD
jgi:FtsH-binding integral membrane protein